MTVTTEETDMVMTSPEPTRDAAARGGRTEPIAVTLTEGADGWTLSVTADRSLLASALAGLATGDSATTRVSVSIMPNLVPGEPFDATVLLAVTDEEHTSLN
jgi:hypothetical protein